MDAKGHHECAAEAGEPLLKDALERTGHGEQRLAAFYLGNWCTDVSKAVDPVACHKLRDKGGEYLVKPLSFVIKEIQEIPGTSPVVQILCALRDRLVQALTILEDASGIPR